MPVKQRFYASENSLTFFLVVGWENQLKFPNDILARQMLQVLMAN